jgi:hypothetical protein
MADLAFATGPAAGAGARLKDLRAVTPPSRGISLLVDSIGRYGYGNHGRSACGIDR